MVLTTSLFSVVPVGVDTGDVCSGSLSCVAKLILGKYWGRRRPISGWSGRHVTGEDVYMLSGAEKLGEKDVPTGDRNGMIEEKGGS